MDNANTVKTACHQVEDVAILASPALLTPSVNCDVQPKLDQQELGQEHPGRQEPSLQELEAKLQPQQVHVDELEKKLKTLSVVGKHPETLEEPQVGEQESALLLKKPIKHLKRLDKQLRRNRELHVMMLTSQRQLDRDNAAMSVPPEVSNLPVIQYLIDGVASELQVFQEVLKRVRNGTKEDIIEGGQMLQIDIHLLRLKFKEVTHRQQAHCAAQLIDRLDIEQRKKQSLDCHRGVIPLTLLMSHHSEKRERYENKVELMTQDLDEYRKAVIMRLTASQKQIPETGNENIVETILALEQELEVGLLDLVHQLRFFRSSK